MDEPFAMIEAESTFLLLCLFRVALVAMLGQEGTNFLFEESDLLGLEGLPVGSHGGSTAQEDQRSNKSFSGAHHYDYVRAIRNQ